MAKQPDSDLYPHTAPKPGPCGIDPTTDCRAVDAMAEMIRICRRIEASIAELRERMAKGDIAFALNDQWKESMEKRVKALEDAQEKAVEEKEGAMKAIIATVFQWAIFLVGVVGVAATIIINTRVS
jgi:hypothetical protein